MKILSAQQMKEVDAFTIQNEPVAAIDLMERAAMACVKRIVKLCDHEEQLLIVCGKGNNGGDGLAIARLLVDLGYDCVALLINYSNQQSEDAHTNYLRLKEKYPAKLKEISTMDDLMGLKTHNGLLIDALLGTGINKPVEGFLGEVISFVNEHFNRIISIDLPSGLFTDKSSSENKFVVKANLTLSFQMPKLAFMFAENKNSSAEFELLDIGLLPAAIEKQATRNYYITKADVAGLLQPRNKFSHKGIYGHALLLAGSKGKSGAAIISAKAAMRSGTGLLTTQSTKETLNALLLHLPEAMGLPDEHPDFISGVEKPERFDAIAFGPGTGTEAETQQTLKKILHYYTGKLVIDADGLNILSENKTWLEFLPPSTILTPHPKEFERLCGRQDDDFERLETLRQFSVKRNCIVILKGAHSAIAMPDGNVFFNSSGNACLAKAGSGDALTGIILGLLSRGYNAPQAAIIGTFVHGYAADLCARKKSKESILISDVIECLLKAFKQLEKLKFDFSDK